MKDRVQLDIGAKKPTSDWSEIDWKEVMKKVKNLRQRIYRATMLKKWNQVRSLMKLMLRSYSNLLLSVRRVTQLNQGKKTPGIDGYTVKSPEDRVQLIKNWDFQIWKIKPTKRIYIPKANGKSRPLGIPTVSDRIAQAIVKNALEPSWEARFEKNSFGFRPGRGGHDAIEGCFLRFRKGGIDEWILDADIKGAFDNISHEFILEELGQIPGREFIKQWLKAGYVESQIFNGTDKGTPQGGILSPLLANIALDGMDKWLAKITETKFYGKIKGWGKEERRIYGFVRYADDFIVTAQTKEQIEAIIPRIQEWLAERGLHLNEEKTQIIMAKGMLGKHTLDAGFGQFCSILKWICWKRGVYFAEVDHRGTSQECPECGTYTGKKGLAQRVHTCSSCGYITDRDVASAQVICSRGLNAVGQPVSEIAPRGVLTGAGAIQSS